MLSAGDPRAPPRRESHLNHVSLWRYVLDARRTERGDPAAIHARQRARLAALVRFARARSPLYGELYRDLRDEHVDLASLPPVTKSQLMARFDEWVTDPAVTRAGVDAFLADRSLVGHRYLGRYVVMSTSGISGVRGIFLHDPEAVAVYRALTLLRGWLPRVTPRNFWAVLRRGNRLAALVVVGGHYGGATVFEAARRDHPWPFDRIRVLSVARPLPDLVRELNDFQPAQLIGYPTALALLAEEQQAGRLRIRPAIVGAGGDWLSPTIRGQIEAAFGVAPRQNYGASEFTPLAWDCRRGALHVSADWAILEPVDEAWRPVPAGRPSHSVLLTNLANRIQPVIRYDLGDTVTVGPDPCPCGSPLPTVSVTGRRDDALRLASPDGRDVSLQPNAILRLTGEVPGVRLSQVIQMGPTDIGVRLDVAPGADDAAVCRRVMEVFQGHLAAHGLSNVRLRRLPGPPRRDPVLGKLRRVVVEMGADQPGPP